MSLESSQIDTLKSRLIEGITIEKWNGISQQLAVAMGIDIKNQKIDIPTRRLLRDLSREISTDENALTPHRIPTKKYGYKAAHTVREGDRIQLDADTLNTLIEKYAGKIQKKGDAFRWFTSDDIALRANGFMQKTHELLISNGFHENPDKTYSDGMFIVSLDEKNNLLYKKIEKTVYTPESIQNQPLIWFPWKVHEFLTRENWFTPDYKNQSYTLGDFQIFLDRNKEIASNKKIPKMTDKEKLYLLATQQALLAR